MTIKDIIEYVLHTPHNTNRAILTYMLRDMILYYGGNPDNPGEPGDPDAPNKDIIYDGGMET